MTHNHFIAAPSPSLGYLLGALKGDGTVGCWDSRHYVLRLSAYEKNFAENTAEAMRTIINPTWGKIKPFQINDGRWVAQAFCKDFVLWYNVLSLKTLEKTVRPFFADFVRGFADAEGSVHIRSLSLSNSNIKLLEMISKFLAVFKIKNYIILRTKKGSVAIFNGYRSVRTKDVFNLLVTTKKDLTVFHDKIGFSIKRKMDELKDIIKITDKEQTAISPTKEYGFKYLDLTKELSGRKIIAHSIG